MFLRLFETSSEIWNWIKLCRINQHNIVSPGLELEVIKQKKHNHYFYFKLTHPISNKGYEHYTSLIASDLIFCYQ